MSEGRYGKASGPLSADKERNVLRLLLVDDNLDLLEVTADLFRESGLDVLTAASGEQALDLLQSTPHVDVLITDVVMPGMNGIELGYEVRRRLPGLKVVLVSGYPNPAMQSGRLQDFSFLRKPYRMVEVMRLLAMPN